MSGTHRARREAVLRQATERADANGEYRGINNYVDYHKGFRREHTIGSEKGSGMALFWCIPAKQACLYSPAEELHPSHKVLLCFQKLSKQRIQVDTFSGRH
jgi:hypothetical protein